MGMTGLTTHKAAMKPQLKLAGDYLDLTRLEDNVIVSHLEKSKELREMTLNQRLKKGMLH